MASDEMSVGHHDIQFAGICAAVQFVEEGNMNREIKAVAIEAGFRPRRRRGKFLQRQRMNFHFLERENLIGTGL